MNMTKKEALRCRQIIEQAVQLLDDDTALEAVSLFPEYKEGKSYEAGQRVRRGGELFRIQTSHTSRADQKPDEANSRLARVQRSGSMAERKQ